MNRTGYLMLSGLLWWLALAAAHGQTSAWLDFSGQIKGESADGAHPGWITIQGFGLGTQLQSGHRGSFSLTKQVDRASPPLFLACAVGTHYPGANLDLNSTPDNTRLARLELVDVSIVADLTASTATGLTETVTLEFGKITYTYFTLNAGTVFSNFNYSALAGAAGTGTLTDTDGDGMPDAWEAADGFSLGYNDANEDADGDGFSNLDEYLLGTNPRDGSSFFKATLAPLAEVPGTYQLSWNSVAGKSYLVEWSPDLNTPFDKFRIVTATAPTTSITFERGGPLGFYRVSPRS